MGHLRQPRDRGDRGRGWPTVHRRRSVLLGSAPHPPGHQPHRGTSLLLARALRRGRSGGSTSPNSKRRNRHSSKFESCRPHSEKGGEEREKGALPTTKPRGGAGGTTGRRRTGAGPPETRRGKAGRRRSGCGPSLSAGVLYGGSGWVLAGRKEARAGRERGSFEHGCLRRWLDSYRIGNDGGKESSKRRIKVNLIEVGLKPSNHRGASR